MLQMSTKFLSWAFSRTVKEERDSHFGFSFYKRSWLFCLSALSSADELVLSPVAVVNS